jgi:hypothetical protein
MKKNYLIVILATVCILLAGNNFRLLNVDAMNRSNMDYSKPKGNFKPRVTDNLIAKKVDSSDLSKFDIPDYNKPQKKDFTLYIVENVLISKGRLIVISAPNDTNFNLKKGQTIRINSTIVKGKLPKDFSNETGLIINNKYEAMSSGIMTVIGPCTAVENTHNAFVMVDDFKIYYYLDDIDNNEEIVVDISITIE